jgi:hypothetical protein
VVFFGVNAIVYYRRLPVCCKQKHRRKEKALKPGEKAKKKPSPKKS